MLNLFDKIHLEKYIEILKKEELRMSAETGPKTKKSSYRQSGYLNLTTGEIEEFYGSEVPADLSNYKKIWDNNVVSVTTITPVVEETLPAPMPTEPA